MCDFPTSSVLSRNAQLCHGAALALLLIWASPARAQQPRFVHVTQDQGLSDNTVLAIAEDPRGFMWFGTEDGLNRYDGYDVVVYRHDAENPRSLRQNFVPALLVDREGTLWVGTGDGLDSYNPASPGPQRQGRSRRPTGLGG